MVGAVSGVGSYFSVYHYPFPRRNSSVQAAQTPGEEDTASPGVRQPDAVGNGSRAAGGVNGTGGRRYSMPPVNDASSQEAGNTVPDLFIRKGADPAEYAVRMRMQNLDPEVSGLSGETEKTLGTKGAKGAEEDGECQTCEQRRYQDGSDDMGVSFKTPTRIAPEAAVAMVRGHEQEHVVRERAKAEREDRQVVSQKVTLHTDICPECGKVYVSGGTTQTTTASKPEKPDNVKPEEAQGGSFSAVA